MSDVDLNNSSKACSPCLLECKKINKRINDRKHSKIKTKVSSYGAKQADALEVMTAAGWK